MDTAQIQAFFFKAMMEGWISGGQEITNPNMPGYKTLLFRDEDFFLHDCYCVNPNSTKSVGATTIFFQNAPVWVMNYGGFYEDGVITFLKSALRETYRISKFVGGRGPLAHLGDSLIYEFNKFEGREEVLDKESRTLLGFHEYWGMSLL